jgi:hypothetical protein
MKMFFNSKNIVPVYNEAGQQLFARYEEHVQEIIKMFKLSTREEALKQMEHIGYIPPEMLCANDKNAMVVNYQCKDFWADGTPKSLSEKYVSYSLEDTCITSAAERLGVDLIHMIGLEIAALADIPFAKARPDLYGHQFYVRCNWGAYANGAIGLDICCHTPVGSTSRYGKQQLLSLAVPAFRSAPAPEDTFDRCSAFPQYEMEGGIYRKYVHLPNIFKSLHLNYYEPMDVALADGSKKHLPSRASIAVRDLKEVVRALALYAFDKYYGLQKVPRGGWNREGE